MRRVRRASAEAPAKAARDLTFLPCVFSCAMKYLLRETQEVERSIGEMRVLRILLQFAAFVMLFILVACATTKFLAVWKDDTYQGRPQKILVINAFPSPATRRLFEDEFVTALKDRRIDSVMSYTTMPDPIISDMNAIAAQANAVGADAVLINKPIGTTQGETSGAGGMTYRDVYVNTQTEVHDMKSNKLIMSVTAETWINQGKPYPAQIRSYVKALVKKLSR